MGEQLLKVVITVLNSCFLFYSSFHSIWRRFFHIEPFLYNLPLAFLFEGCFWQKAESKTKSASYFQKSLRVKKETLFKKELRGTHNNGGILAYDIDVAFSSLQRGAERDRG